MAPHDKDERTDRGSPPSIDRFGDPPTRDLDDWHALWEHDLRFPVRSHRGAFGRVLVFFKRLLRPLVSTPQNDLWERQRVYNLILLEELRNRLIEIDRRLEQDKTRLDALEGLVREGLDEIMRHGDALYSLVDQKLDRYRRELKEQTSLLRASLVAVQQAAGDGDDPAVANAAASLRERLDEGRYTDLEERHRGSRDEIAERVRQYGEDLAGKDPVLDLGCGRGETLEVLRELGLSASGVDSSAEMVRLCRERGLEAERADVVDALVACEPASLGAVVCFHVVEHLPADTVDRLVDQAWRALRPGGVLLFETPNPESLVAGACRFWIDPTHLRPVHPSRLRSVLETAGFEVEIRPCQPFAPEQRLPEIDPETLGPEGRELVYRLNLVRDHLDRLLYGFQDYAAIGRKP